MKVLFDLRGILSSQTSGNLRMAGMVRVNLEWARYLAPSPSITFIAPGVYVLVKTVLSSDPEWLWLASKIDHQSERLFDKLGSDFLLGRWRASRLRHLLAPVFVKFKYPSDIARYIHNTAIKSEKTWIYFIPFVQRLPSKIPADCIPVMNVYDIIPLLFSVNGQVGDEDYSASIRIVRDQGGHFIVNSAYVRHSLICMFEVPRENVHIVPLGTNTPSTPTQTSGGKENDHPFFLHISGDTQRRKNVEGTVRGFVRFLDQTQLNHELRIVGPDQVALKGIISKYGGKWSSRIKGMGHVSDETLEYLLSSATCGLYLSLHEGFGLPPLEAMKYGLPMICTSATSVPEVVGDAALLVDPFDDEAIADAMRRIVTDSDLYDKLSTRGRNLASNSSWQKSSDLLLTVFEKILS